MKRVIRLIIITAMYALPLSGAIGPIQKAEHDLLASKQTINSQIDSIRNLLLQLINMLQTQQKDADTQKNDLLKKQNTIDTSNKALTSARQEVNQNKLLPKDVKDPLNEMFNSTGSLISQMSNVITKGIQTTHDVEVLVPDVIIKIKNVVQNIDKYSKVIRDGMNTAAAAIKPLSDAERVANQAGKAITQTGQAITQAAQQGGQAITQAAQQTGKAIEQTAQQTGQVVTQATQQAGQTLQQAPAKIEQGLKDFGKMLGIG